MATITKKNEPIWVEAYRPEKIKDCILPNRIKSVFQAFVNKDEFPNLLLSGSAGTGKTTIALALCNELGYDVLMINASSERNIDTVRTTLYTFASRVSLHGNKKVVILDEADSMGTIAQDAMRGLIEEFPQTRFIFTCNFKNKIRPAIQSRTTTIDFSIQASEKKEMMVEFLQHIFLILDNENVKYDRKTIGQIVKTFYPDNRKILNELQKYSIKGDIDTGILVSGSNGNADEMVLHLKDKNIAGVRQWIVNNQDVEPPMVYRMIYDSMYNAVTAESVPVLCLAVADYQYYSAFVANQEINLMALASRLISEVEFK